MRPLSEMYKQSFFGRRHKLDWRAAPVCTALIHAFDLKKDDTVIDVGCAIGEYVRYFNEFTSIGADGLEGSPEAKYFFVSDRIRVLDLRREIRGYFSWRYTLAYSFEVAEHIEPEYADRYVSNLVCMSDQILITAAPPGQKGHHHFNCQPKNYWEKKFFAHKMFRRHDLEDKFKKGVPAPYRFKREIRGYLNNVMIFCKRGENGEKILR